MSAIKSKLSQISKSLLFITEFAQDLYYYTKYCGASPLQVAKRKAYYKIIIETHAIEKGLSLANPRLLFGRQKIPAIMKQVRWYGIGSDEMPIRMAVGALNTYLTVHRAAGINDPILDEITSFLKERSSASQKTGTGGLRNYANGLPGNHGDGANLLQSRFSCRMFSPEPLDSLTLERIVELAQTAPSQCNRQATKIYFFDNPGTISTLLQLQAGSSGFAETVTGLIVVAFDLAAWGGAQQRNQGYVDASLFAMNFMLAAHSVGAATCPLNLAVRHTTERKIKSVGGIPNDQRLVMMIALGWPALGALKAAASPRRSVTEVLRVVHD